MRLALGASRREVLSKTVVGGLAPAVAGGLAGLPVAWTLARAFPTLFFDVTPFDAGSSIAGAAILVLVALAAALLPARRAARVDPNRGSPKLVLDLSVLLLIR